MPYTRPAPRVFTPEELATLKVTYNTIDANGDGQLSIQEAKAFFESAGLPVELLAIAYYLYDDDDNGSLSFEEFAKFLADLEHLSENSNYLYVAMFDKIDADHDGAIGAEELMRFSAAAGEEITIEQAREFIAGVDDNGDGKIQFDEMVKALGL